jgi:hypothetical protein
VNGAANHSARRMGQLRKHNDNVRDGHILPTTKDLLWATSYMGNDIHLDMRTFACVAIRRIRSEATGAAELKRAFQNIALDGAGLKEVLDARKLLKKHGPVAIGKSTTGLFLIRLEIYCASLNHPPMVQLAWKRCLEAATLAQSNFDAFHYLRAGLGWYAVSQRTYRAQNDSGEIRAWGERTLEQAFKAWTDMRAPAAVATQADATPVESTPDAPGTLTVLKSIGNADLVVGRRIKDEFKAVLNVPLPLVPTPDLAEVRRALLQEFPHVRAVIDAMLDAVRPNRFIAFQPTILCGPPGSGKTRFCRRFFTLLGVKLSIYSCGGVHDAAIAGAARHWSSAEPSYPLTMMRQHETASLGIILDEIEKASVARTNGSLFDSLLGMVEPESSTRWYDNYVQAPIDLSSVLWMATANSLADVPAPLLDRFRVLEFNEPDEGFLEPLARTLMREIAEDRGLHLGWASPLTREELDSLWKVWPGGSLRALRRYLEAVMTVREAEASQMEPN